MPSRTILTGYSISVVEVPAVEGLTDTAGRMIILTDVAEPHNSIVFPMPESLAKEVGHKLVGHGKVRTATPEEVANITSMIQRAA